MAKVETIVPRLKAKYDSEIKGRLKERFQIDNPNAVPRLEKIVIDMGVKGAVENKTRVDQGARHALPDPRNEGQEEGLIDGQDHLDRQVFATGEVQHAQLHALLDVLAPPRRLPEVQDLPHLPARARSQGRDPGHAQGLVVSS